MKRFYFMVPHLQHSNAEEVHDVDPRWLTICRFWVCVPHVTRPVVSMSSPVSRYTLHSQVPIELRGYETLLSALGVPKEFSPSNFVEVLHKIEAKAAGRPLDADTLATAVGRGSFIAACTHAGAAPPCNVHAHTLLFCVFFA